MELQQTFEAVREASRSLAFLSDALIHDILLDVADAAQANAHQILIENKKDLDLMDPKDPKYDRLKLTVERIAGIASDMRAVADLPSPLGRILSETTRPNGMHLSKVSVAFGVIGIIYESRPNVSFDVFSLCLKSGNACLLKGSKDAHQSNVAIVAIIHDVLKKFGVNPAVCTLLPAEREATAELLNARGLVDLIIPRGSANLINFVRENARIPVIETGAGICHTYFDVDGDLVKGAAIINNAKTRRVSVCNALDCLLVNEKRLKVLPELCAPLASSNVIIYADPSSYEVLSGNYPDALLEKATVESFGTEFLDYKMAVRSVSDLQEALQHIARNSSQHSECIISENVDTCTVFERSVDAACVYTNVSTAFTDGAQFGLGAEIGISTQKLHARGPMALEELTTYKWLVRGNGQIRNLMKTNETQGPLVEIVTIGDEILIGQIVDTNSAWMARELNKDGFRVHQITTVSDDERHILKAVDGAFSRADIVLMTGGLGPTKDDITKQTLCKYFNTELVHNQEVVDNIKEVFAHRGNVLNPLTLGQAMVPASATIIQNKRGSAPVTWFDKKGKVLVSMPGVPFEMEWVMSNEVLPRLRTKFNTPTLLHKTVLVVGISESGLAMKLTDWENELHECLKLAYLPSPGMVKLRLSGFLPDRVELENIIEAELVKLRSILEGAILAEEDAPVEEIIGRLLREKGLWIATAESCTGGNIAKLITNVSGSSSYFAGAIVAYQNELKIKELGVSPDTLHDFGAVSQETVEEMAEGVRQRLNTDIGVAVSGIAGPTGATEGKPVGTTWISVCTQDKSLSRRFQFGTSRKRNVDLATLNAFAMIKECLE